MEIRKAEPITKGIEDKFWYVINEKCIKCGKCARNCPVHAIAKGIMHYEIDCTKCIDCGTCAYGCPAGAVEPV